MEWSWICFSHPIRSSLHLKSQLKQQVNNCYTFGVLFWHSLWACVVAAFCILGHFLSSLCLLTSCLFSFSLGCLFSLRLLCRSDCWDALSRPEICSYGYTPWILQSEFHAIGSRCRLSALSLDYSSLLHSPLIVSKPNHVSYTLVAKTFNYYNVGRLGSKA